MYHDTTMLKKKFRIRSRTRLIDFLTFDPKIPVENKLHIFFRRQV